MKNYTRKHVSENGDIFYYNKAGQFHRTDGPAIIKLFGGYKTWWINQMLHRIDGPAFVADNGHEEWWVKSEQLNRKQRKKLKRLRNLFQNDDLLSFLLLEGEIVL